MEAEDIEKHIYDSLVNLIQDKMVYNQQVNGSLDRGQAVDDLIEKLVEIKKASAGTNYADAN